MKTVYKSDEPIKPSRLRNLANRYADAAFKVPRKYAMEVAEFNSPKSSDLYPEPEQDNFSQPSYQW